MDLQTTVMEQIDYFKAVGHTPRNALNALGVLETKYEVATWGLVEHELREAIFRMRGEL